MHSLRNVALLSLFIATCTGLLFSSCRIRRTPPPNSIQTPRSSPIQKPDVLKAEADKLSKQGFSQYKDNQFDAAIQSWNQALMRYQELQNFSGEAITFKENALQQEAIVLGALGDAFYAKRKYNEAIESHQNRLEIAKKLEDPQQKAAHEGAAWGGIGNAYLAQREYNKAIESHQNRLEIAELLKDYEQKSAAVSSLGNTYYSRYYSRGGEKDYQEALKLFGELLTLANSRTPPDLQGAATALGGMGGTHHAKGEYKTAIEKYKQRLTIIEKLEDPVLKLELKADTLSSLGSAYYLMGNYTEVRNYHEQSLDIAEEIRNLGRETIASRIEAISRGGLGSFYHAIGDYETAIKYHNRRLEIARAINDKGEEGAALGSLGNAYHARRKYGTKKDPIDYLTAIEYHRQRLAIVQEIGDRRGEAITLGSLGSVYYDQRDYNTAIKFYEQRLKIAEGLGDLRLQGSAQGELGTAYYSLKKFSKAIEYARRFLEISKDIGDQSGVGNAQNNLGVFYFANGEVAEAVESLKESIKVREGLRRGLPDTEKVFFFDTQLNAYVNLQKVLTHQKKTNEALEIAEAGRAQAFVELLARRQQTVKIQPITIAEIQETARIQKTTFVEYSLIEDSGIDDEKQLLIWVVKPTGTVEFKQIKLKDWEEKWKKEFSSSSFFLQTALQDDRGQIQRDLFVIRSAVGVNVHGSKDIPKITPENKKKVLQAFYELLIGSIANLLPSNENDRVVFIPQGALFLVPFAALQDTSGKYLIDKHTILTAPSIQVLKQLQSETPRKPLIFESLQGEDLLIVGNPTMPKLDCSEELPLSKLEGAEKEAIKIAEDFKTEAIIHDRAKEVAVTALMPKAQIIHLATHSLLNNCKGLAVPGAIALAPSGNNEVDEARDGWLTTSEISRLQLQAELVVLSACDTGRGRLTGDGVIGLSRSFMGAGVPSVIVSLWNVNDKSTAELMTQFYQHLKYQSKQGNLDKAQALRQAILKTKGMKQYSDPFDWSAFTLIGLP